MWGGWIFPLSISTAGQVLDTHPSLRVQQQRLVQPKPYSLWPAQSYQTNWSGSWRREITPAERIKPVISREGWAASLSTAVITAGATACADVNSLTGRITSQDSLATSPVLPHTRLCRVRTVALAGRTHQLLHPARWGSRSPSLAPCRRCPQPGWGSRPGWGAFSHASSAGGVKNEWSSGLRTSSGKTTRSTKTHHHNSNPSKHTWKIKLKKKKSKNQHLKKKWSVSKKAPLGQTPAGGRRWHPPRAHTRPRRWLGSVWTGHARAQPTGRRAGRWRHGAGPGRAVSRGAAGAAAPAHAYVHGAQENEGKRGGSVAAVVVPTRPLPCADIPRGQRAAGQSPGVAARCYRAGEIP